MNFGIVKRQIIKEYISIYGTDRKEDPWSLGACIDIFRYFYKEYKQIFNQDHPYLSDKSIYKILKSFPYLDNSIDYKERQSDISPQEYYPLIDAYFQQDFYDCNYSIAHFMSGVIRTLRYYEELY